ARRAKPAFMLDPRREIETYREILAPMGIDAPRFYGAVANVRRRRYWLFLERMTGAPMTEIGDWGTWLAAARWLARLHVRLTNAAALSSRAIAYDACFYRLWPPRALAANDVHQPELTRLASAYERIVDRLAGMPRSLIHGEMYA